jgi:ParB family chromosome partitioning protein
MTPEVKPMSETIVHEIRASTIRAGTNDRKHFDEVKLGELAESISEHGLAEPIIVRPVTSFCGVGYEIVAGERRFRAMTTILDRSFIPAIVRELDDESASAIMLAENTGRADLDPIEEANAYQSRIERFGWR